MSRTTLTPLTTLALLLAVAPGCQLEKLFPDQVAEGVARLAVVNSGYITSIINSDTVCGLASERVTMEVEGEAGAPGIVRYSVQGCTLAYNSLTEVARSCDGVGTSVMGSVTVDAVQEIAGQLTGDPENPVIPASADAVSIFITAQFDNWRVVGDETPGWMENHTGAVSFVAKPRLAVGSKAEGVCSAPTANVAFNDIVLSEGTATVSSEGREFQVDIVSSHLDAQLGAGPERENSIEGTVHVWDSDLTLANNVLDENYNAAEFLNGFTDEECLDRQAQEAHDAGREYDRVATPLSYECKGVEDMVADGAARLLVQTAGMIASYMEEGADCGFASVDVDVDADVGGPGTGTWTVENCVIELPPGTVLATDCAGNETRGSGRAVVNATKSLTGWLSGDAVNPVIPLDDNPARLQIEVTLEGLSVGSGLGSIQLPSGTLSATVEPRTAYSESTGTCSVPTSHVRMSDITFVGPTAARIEAPQGTFTVELQDASLDATVGQWTDENHIAGSISVGKNAWDIADLPSGNVLNAGYDAGTFDDGFAACDEELAGAPLSYECDFETFFSGGVARLGVNAFAQVVQAMEADTTCGFSSPGVIDAVVVDDSENGLGRDGASAVYTVEECVLDFSTPTQVGEPDCNGNATTLTGRVTVSGTKMLKGISSGDPGEPIVPTSWQPATIVLDVAYEDFHVQAGATPQTVTVASGTATGTLKPQTAIDSATGACSIPTQNVEIDVAWTKGQLVVHSEGTNVAALVDNADIAAVNGRIDTVSNTVDGAIRIAGTDYTVEGDLNPDYDAVEFASNFNCAEGYEMPGKESACNFKRTLGENIARLIVQATGEAAGQANAEAGCAFSGIGVMTSPTDVVGDPGEQGSMTFRIEECTLGDPAEDGPNEISENCMGDTKHHVGEMTITGERQVEGLREEINILFSSIDSIVPNFREAVTVDLEEVVFNEFQVYNLDEAGDVVDLGLLTIHNGTLSADVAPRLSENADTPGSFDVATPVAELTQVAVSELEVTLEAEGKTFKTTINSSMMDAFNGSYQGQTNELSGAIVVDGVEVLLGDMSLVPNFDQAQFNASYACDELLMDGPI